MRRNKFSIIKRRLKKIVTIALNVFYAKKEKIYPAYDSNYYSNCEVNDLVALSCSKIIFCIINIKRSL